MQLGLKPINARESLFMVFICIAGIFAVIMLPPAYDLSLVLVIAISLGISWAAMQLIARFIEGRWLWPPSEQFAGFIWGDLIGLPGAAVAFFIMGQHVDSASMSDSVWWRVLVIIVGVAVGVGFHAMEANGTFYTASMLHSPTKLWHDLFVFPVYTVFLGSKLPWLWESNWGFSALAGFNPAAWANLTLLTCSVAFWGYLALVYDATHRKPNAHIDFRWSHTA